MREFKLLICGSRNFKDYDFDDIKSTGKTMLMMLANLEKINFKGNIIIFSLINNSH